MNDTVESIVGLIREVYGPRLLAIEPLKETDKRNNPVVRLTWLETQREFDIVIEQIKPKICMVLCHQWRCPGWAAPVEITNKPSRSRFKAAVALHVERLGTFVTREG